ncbi:MAG: hypothetical protein Q7S27_06610 [Nanoarchaeota archaeon]|nr:hypothetical protein [Nanoarchaeota archaeon]
MKKSASGKIVIATTTFYNFNNKSDRIRAKIAERTFRKAQKEGYLVICVDGGSPLKFIEKIRKLGVKVYPQKIKGMGNSRRQVFSEAYKSGKEIIIWTEPEKESFIKEIKKAVGPIIKEKADMVIPKRKSLKSYPVSQMHIERFGNAFWKQLTGKDLDIWAGMRIFKRDIVKYFLDYVGEYGDTWEILVIPIMDIIKDKNRIVSLEINYQHPKEQTHIEEKDIEFYKKRLDQLNNLIPAVIDHWNKLKNRHI